MLGWVPFLVIQWVIEPSTESPRNTLPGRLSESKNNKGISRWLRDIYSKDIFEASVIFD